MDSSTYRVHPWSLVLAGLCALIVALGIGRFLLTPMLPVMQRIQHLDLFTAGALAAATNVGYLLGALSCTVLRVRSDTLLRLGIAAIAVFTMAMAVTAQPL